MPVILSECTWTYIPIIKDAAAVPFKGKPVNTFDTIESGIEEAAEMTAKKIRDYREKLGIE